MTAPQVATLPMYDFPSTAGSLDALWAHMAERLLDAGIPAPQALTRGGPPEAAWRDPGLLLGQTCGYPLMRGLRGRVALVGTPMHRHPGCEGPRHRSFVVARAADPRASIADFRGSRAAVNAWDSNTGMNLFRAEVAAIAGGQAFFAAILTTGSHRASLAAVAEGEADLAAIDCVSLALIAAEDPRLASKVRKICATPAAPGLPFIAAAALPDRALAAVQEALEEAFACPGLAREREKLGWIGLTQLGWDAYDEILALERAAAAAGYPRLC